MSHPPTHQAEELALAHYLTEQSGQVITVKFIKPLAGGGSRDTWLLELTRDGQPQQVVLRRDYASEIFEHTLTRAQEFTLLEIAQAGGVTVPTPLWVCMDAAVLGHPFLLMTYVDGISIGVKIVHAPEIKPFHAMFPLILGQQLAQIHQIALDDPRLAFLQRPAADMTPAEQALADVREMLTRLESANPVLVFGIHWLEQHLPPPSDMVFVHGDYRIGNFIVGERGLHAIIDWEFCHVGDPHEDLAWGCVRDWRFGNGDLQFGGVSEREPYIQAYEEASGRTINRNTLDFWEIMGNLRWAVTCLSQAERHLSGHSPSVEFASLGRRSAEMQLELLRLIEQKGI